MIDYDIVNNFVGKRWVYIENDCWSVFREASAAIFGRPVVPVKIPPVSCVKKNAELFEHYFNNDLWPIVNSPRPGDAVLFKSRKGYTVHIGLYIEKGNILHCMGTPTIAGQTMYEQLSTVLARYKTVEFRRCK
jgi:hypothetical protein